MDFKENDLQDQQLPVGETQLREWTEILRRYEAGLKRTKSRIIAAENWWKMRNTLEAQKVSEQGKDGGFTSQSGWLHNVITSKHADAMDAFPEPLLLPREPSDKPEAQILSDIIPCILEQNEFEETYSDAMWQKCKTGTGAYKVTWDQSKVNGLGDISVSCVNLLNLAWEPEVTDIQKSRYFFHFEARDRDLVEDEYPDLKGKLKGQDMVVAKFLNDETANDQADKVTVIEVYYHKKKGGKNTLQYCKYVGHHVLYATENENVPGYDEMGNIIEAPMSFRGLYDHGLFPYVFDPLFPVEGSPCGYGYVDVCRNPQITIDMLKTSIVKNAKVGATPRYFSRMDGNIQEAEFLDLSKPIIHVSGTLDETAIRPVDYNPLPGNYLNVLQDTVQELRETSGNTEAGTGNAPAGVTAASALAALQEASGKGSRDASRGSYRSFRKLINMCLELIRQFYDLPRKFRIVGADGAERFVSYTNDHLVAQYQGAEFGEDMGARLPVFDIKVSAQKKNAYTSMAQNELALQFYQMGFFNPMMADQSLMCLEMMDFDGKEELIQKVSRNAMIQQLLAMQAAAAGVAPGQEEPAQGGSSGGGAPKESSGAPNVPDAPMKKEHATVSKARAHANNVSQP